ncbi:OLC1v1014262C1 [Oldenlandia corymbosa var. corymbosa]|uniref:OLC1v1014262C1 n=1 Tax=Oldenlandia corymbosa var. corymbosa TaxID=529605 RepID=A0AAV1E2G6_OLDCO|nr:OLC1v1014262C1 [Oldenlandia corymbosa var. corymbosa]
MRSPRWGYVRIIAGTIAGGMLGFYVMHRAELYYKEMWNERLKRYEEELNRKKMAEQSNEFQESL